MRSQSLGVSLAVPVLLGLVLFLAACAPVPVLPAPTAVAPATAPATEVALPTPTPPTAALTAPAATGELTPTATIVAQVTAPVSVTAPVTETVAAPTWAATTYRDEVGGWEVDYPAGWSLTDVAPEIKQESIGYSVTLTSWQPQEPGTQGIPEGGSKLDIGVTKNGAESEAAAVEARRAEMGAGDAGSRIVFEEPWDLASGARGVHWTIQPANGDTIHEFVTAINGSRVVVSGYGEEALFEQIVATLRPLSAAKAAQEVMVPMVAAGGANESAAAAAAPASTAYTVRSGDTLAKIAARFGVSVQAILAANPQIANPDRIYVGQRITIPTGGSRPPTPAPPPGTTRVNIYMIGLNDGSVGCGDSIVPVRRDAPRTNAPLTAALNLLLGQKAQYYGESGLYNALYQSDLRIASITRSGGAWTINLTGTLRLGGVCDNPRVKAQLEQTALQFSTVQSVRYFINGKPLDTVLSGK